jgi:hypothetical protein
MAIKALRLVWPQGFSVFPWLGAGFCRADGQGFSGGEGGAEEVAGAGVFDDFSAWEIAIGERAKGLEPVGVFGGDGWAGDGWGGGDGGDALGEAFVATDEEVVF